MLVVLYFRAKRDWVSGSWVWGGAAREALLAQSRGDRGLLCGPCLGMDCLNIPNISRHFKDTASAVHLPQGSGALTLPAQSRCLQPGSPGLPRCQGSWASEHPPHSTTKQDCNPKLETSNQERCFGGFAASCWCRLLELALPSLWPTAPWPWRGG
ncbi:unnamed protein product [Symbiodinium natans]|uniref:Uncharacterized protein n=1 Tax=Symbiodinium natans TaxID=878477 RepID=A0A812LHT6_9DINO|nr:unnamed protein product [Symbiodinium natans]